MLRTEFTLDVKSACSVGGSSFITTSGAYIGTITAARTYEAKSGAQMLNIDFESVDLERAHIQMNLFDKEGNETFNYKIFNSLMYVCRAKSSRAEQRRYKDRQGNEQVGLFIPEIMGKTVGLLIQAGPEEYKLNGEIKTMIRLNLLTPFDPNTRQTANELHHKLEAKAVDAKLKNLKDKPLKKLAVQTSNDFESAPAPRGGYEPAPAPIPQAAPAGDFSPDDVPF